MSIQFLQAGDLWFWSLFIASAGVLIWSFLSLAKVRAIRWPVYLRIVILILAMIGLLQPKITQRFNQTSPLQWNIYLDNSISMGYHQGQSIASINQGVTDLLSQMESKSVPFKRYFFSSQVYESRETQALDASGPSTDLGSVITHIRESQPRNLAGAVLITDGQTTQGVDPLEDAGDIQVPFFVIGVGDTTPMVDAFIQSIDAPTVAVKGGDVDVAVVVSTVGEVHNRMNVTLYHGKKAIGSRFVRIQGEGSRSVVRFRFQPDALGKNTYRTHLSSLESEINIVNNRQSFTITVLKDKYRIALLTGVPSFNTPVIKRFLHSNSRYQIDHFTMVQGSFRPSIKRFWEEPYDLIILDNFPVVPLSNSWQRFFAKKLLTHKSAIGWIVGPNVTEESAESLFPFFHIQEIGNVLDKSKSYPWTMTEALLDPSFSIMSSGEAPVLEEADLPPLKPGLLIEAKPGKVNTLALLSSTVSVPLLLAGERDDLRSALWTSPDFYSLHHKLIGAEHSRLASTIWSGLMSWLMRTSGDKEMYFRLDKDTYQQGEVILVTGNRMGRLSPNAQAAITIYRDSQVVNSTELQYDRERERWKGELWASVPDTYSYEITYKEDMTTSSQSGTFVVDESQIELNTVSVNTGLLSRLANKPGGKYLSWATRADILEGIDPDEMTETIIRQVRLTQEWWVLGILVCFLGMEWGLRRWLGLP